LGQGTFGSAAFACGECGIEYLRHGPVWDFAPKAAGEEFRSESDQWDEQAARYEERRAVDPLYMAGVRAALRALGPVGGLAVLDAGCGTGLTTRRLAGRCRSLAALDASAASLAVLAGGRAAGGVLAVRGDLRRLPFAAGTFDRVLCANVLQQFPGRDNHLRVVAELARVTRPGGRVVVSAHAFTARKRWKGWRKAGPAGGHSGPLRFVHRFEPDEFRAVLGSALRVECVTGAAFPLPYRLKLSPLSRVAEAVLSRVPVAAAFGEMVVGRCVRE
jgi:SAM-dependent methyltransferase